MWVAERLIKSGTEVGVVLVGGVEKGKGGGGEARIGERVRSETNTSSRMTEDGDLNSSIPTVLAQ